MFLGVILLFKAVFADEFYQPSEHVDYDGSRDSTWVENTNDYSSPGYLDGVNLYSYYSFGESPGICKDYGAAGIFYTPDCSCCGQGIYYDLSYLYFRDNTFGVSVGLGSQVSTEDGSIVGRGVIYYDFRKGNVGSFHQIGASAGIIGDGFALQANGYFPVKCKEAVSSPIIYDYGDIEDSATPTASAIYTEFVLTGMDVEAGVWKAWRGFTTYLGVGAYYFNKSSLVDYWGGKGALRFEYSRFFLLEGGLFWDKTNNWEGRVLLEVNIPFSLIRNVCEVICCPFKYQRRTRRDSAVHLQSCCDYETNF